MSALCSFKSTNKLALFDILLTLWQLRLIMLRLCEESELLGKEIELESF